MALFMEQRRPRNNRPRLPYRFQQRDRRPGQRIILRIRVFQETGLAVVAHNLLSQIAGDALHACIPELDLSCAVHHVHPDRQVFQD